MTFYAVIREMEEMMNMCLPEKFIVSKKSMIQTAYPEQYILYQKHEDVRRLSELVVTRVSSLSYLIVIPRPLMPSITVEEAVKQGDKYKETKGENKKYAKWVVDSLEDFEKKYPEEYRAFIRSPPIYKGNSYQDLTNTMKIRSCYNAIFLSILKEYETKVMETLKETLEKKPSKPRQKKEPRQKAERVAKAEKSVKVEKKKSIPAAIKKLVWNKNIGEDVGKSKCYCCKSTDITQTSFHCGHVIAESKGGKTIVSNLKPICQNCNSSMGTKDMNDFMSSLL
jgi:5-methylcytosine-specific restriction endonuclease McrA